MSGDKGLLNTKQKWEEETKKINSFLSSVGIDKIQYNTEVDEYLSLTVQQLRSMSKDECFEAAYLLAQHSTVIQSVSNSYQSQLYWAKHNLGIVAAKNADRYGDKYTKYEEKINKLVVDDSYAEALNKMILHCETRIKELDFISGKIANMSNILRGYSNVKE